MPPLTAPRALLSASQQNRIARGKHIHQRCYRVQLQELFSPPTGKTVSHEGNISINDATAYSSTCSSLHQPTKPYHPRATCPPTMPPRPAPRALSTQPNETISHEGNLPSDDATAYSSTSSTFRKPIKRYRTRETYPSTMPPRPAPRALLSTSQQNRITQGQHIHQRCHRAQLHEFLSPPTNETV
jgi:hypothetical protein